MTEKLLFVFIGLGAALVGSLLKDIIWDFLKRRKEPEMVIKHCGDHAVCIKDIDDLKQNVTRNTENITHAQKELDEGRKSFKEVRDDIVIIKQGVTAIITWMKAKGEDIDDKGLFQL